MRVVLSEIATCVALAVACGPENLSPIVRKPTEAADAGAPDVQRDGPNACADCRRVFVTSSSPVQTGALGGVTVADEFCQSTADRRQLGGTWKAWLSTSDGSPSTRFTQSSVPYRLLDGTIVAKSWS